MDELQAEVIAVPPFDIDFLQRGHAVHFRCRHPDAEGIRLDVMSVLRGVDGFEDLWARRSTLELDGERIEVISLPDLVQAKKTQRDKDWPMMRRLIEADYEGRSADTGQGPIRFWLLESRTPEMLLELHERQPELTHSLVAERPLLSLLRDGDQEVLEQALREEELAERKIDRAYWAPLRKELEQLRRQR